MAKRKRRIAFTDEDRVRIRTAKVDLAIALDDYLEGKVPAGRIVNAFAELMLAMKILKEWM